MSKWKTVFADKQRRYKQFGLKEIFKREDGAIDLASIMVGIIVIGLIGGVIAATVFAVIPWAQDNAAKQQLDSIVQAENAYFGLSAAVPSPLPAGYRANTFGNSADLETASLLKQGLKYCAVTSADGKTYEGYSQSDSGSLWQVTNVNSKPVNFTGTLPANCTFITVGVSNPTPTPTGPYVDPTPTITKMTLKCDVTTSGVTPLYGGITGKETWFDGVTSSSANYSNALTVSTKTLNAGVVYTMTFDGTYQRMQNYSFGPPSLNSCLRSVDYWGASTGVNNASLAFDGALNLTSVPAHIPTTITTMRNMFKGATSFNSAGVSTWDVRNVTDMSNMFIGNTSFNQPLNNWNTANVTNMTSMFDGATSFNQPLNNWNVSNLTTMEYMFRNTSMNQPLNNWNTANVTNMHLTFFGAPYQQDLSSWNMANVNRLAFMFQNPKVFNGNVQKTTHSQMIQMTLKCDVTTNGVAPLYGMTGSDTWSDGSTSTYNNTLTANSKTLQAGVEYTMIFEGTFQRLQFYSYGPTSLNSCLRSVDYWGSSTGTNSAQQAFYGATNLTSVPDTIPTSITSTRQMFNGATSINDSHIKNWDVSRVTDMTSMFAGATAFNQDLSAWNTAAVTSGTTFAPATFPNAYLPAKTTK